MLAFMSTIFSMLPPVLASDMNFDLKDKKKELAINQF